MKNKKIIIGALGGITVIITLLFLLIINKNNNNNILSNNDIKLDLNTFAIMLETDVDTGEYEQSTSSRWPSSGYIYNENLSYCENGSTLTWNEETNAINLSTGIADKCYLYFDVILPPDVTVNVANNPTYNVASLSCTGATAEYNQKYQRIEISQINRYTSCNLTYEQPSSTTYLNNYIIGLSGTTQGTGQVVNEQITEDNSTFNPTTTLDQSNYSNLSNDASSPFTWDSTDKTWTSTNKSNSSTSTITFNPSSNGYYLLCYTVSSEAKYDKATFYVDNSQKAQDSGSKSSCVYLGNLTTSNTIKVTYSKDSSSSSGNDNVIFYLQSGTYNENIETVSVGIRYEGKNPNNYIWFNNELWRIIGLFDEATHGVIGQNLVKIIRANSIGGLAWHKSNTNDWTASSLMNLLNGAYYNSQNGTGGEYCYGYSTTTPGNCDYTETGINDTYRPMIENVTWHLGGYSSTSATTEAFYGYERGTTVYSGRPPTTKGYIGLMYPSDYGYSVLSSSCARTTNIGSYNKATCAGQSWLYGQGYEWTITPNSSYSDNVFYVSYVGDPSYSIARIGYAVRPVLYLDSSVYVIDGNGSISDPYIIGM